MLADNTPENPYAVCVYCAAGPRHPELLTLAGDVGRAIAAKGWTLVSGGGNVSAMGAVADGARENGGRTIGVIPKKLVHRELADVNASELIVTDTMRERKQIMEDRSDAFVVLPGGLGTLEEMFEIWTGTLLQMHDKPVVLLDPFDFYAPLLTWLRDLQGQGFVGARALSRLLITESVAGALELIADTPSGPLATDR